ncbi:putative protein LDOC1-like protein [Labeo rohita]|uniref:Uncharacterized protein n=1 Tax=Labeo rohita TaxID=84645 RepID=A0A498NC77_LABRO|nr:putative protein LDOC1-like protein [Labeo rohita]
MTSDPRLDHGITSMDPWHPTPTEVLEDMVNALQASLTLVTTSTSASVSPMAIPAFYAGPTKLDEPPPPPEILDQASIYQVRDILHLR